MKKRLVFTKKFGFKALSPSKNRLVLSFIQLIVTTLKNMEIDFDPVKNATKIRERGLSFERTAEFDFETAQFTIDNRRDYGETLYRVLGFLDHRLHALVFVEIVGGIRVISFRKANKREVKQYETQSRID